MERKERPGCREGRERARCKVGSGPGKQNSSKTLAGKTQQNIMLTENDMKLQIIRFKHQLVVSFGH